MSKYPSSNPRRLPGPDPDHEVDPPEEYDDSSDFDSSDFDTGSDLVFDLTDGGPADEIEPEVEPEELPEPWQPCRDADFDQRIVACRAFLQQLRLDPPAIERLAASEPELHPLLVTAAIEALSAEASTSLLDRIVATVVERTR